MSFWGQTSGSHRLAVAYFFFSVSLLLQSSHSVALLVQLAQQGRAWMNKDRWRSVEMSRDQWGAEVEWEHVFLEMTSLTREELLHMCFVVDPWWKDQAA